jgi:enediyne biosynthesis protein E4
LVVSQNTGSVQIFRNMTDRTFQPVPTKSAFGFWMGLAISDIDNDGDHLFFTNVGQSIPLFLTSGHLRDDQRHTHEWMLWRNDGNFRSTDVTDAYRLTDEGFAWGAVFEDLNLDGQLDLFVAQNYIKWPIHK